MLATSVRRGALATLLFALAGVPALAAETWTEVRSSNFRVVTNGSARDGREVAANFERLAAVLARMSTISTRADVPLTIVAVKTGRQLKSLLGTPRDDIGGLFAPGHDAHVVLLRLDMEKEWRYQIAYHEYMHLLVHQTMGALPLWLSEGLAELYSHARLDTDRILLGVPASYHLEALQEVPPLPLSTFLTVGHESPHYNESNRATIFYAQSWAMAHFLMLGDNGTHRPQLISLLEALDRGVPEMDAVREAFGDVATFELQFRAYIRRFQFAALTDTIPMADATRSMQARTLTAAEALALRATVASALGQGEAAAALAKDAVSADAALPDAWMSQARVSRRIGDNAATESSLEKAIAAGSTDPLAHYGWAELRLSRVPADHPLTDVATALERALALKPDLARAKALLGYVRARQTRDATKGVDLVKEAIQLEPGNARHYLTLAGLLHWARDHASVELLLQRAERTAKGPQEKQKVAEAREQLRP